MDAVKIGRVAVRALYQELTLEPKPGLVSLRDSGSHDDMDATHLHAQSVRAARLFRRASHAPARKGRASRRSRRSGIEAEARMLGATGGVNTHRGAVFALGLLCASAGATLTSGALTARGVRSALRSHWGDSLRERARRARHAPPRLERPACRTRIRPAQRR